MLNIDKGGEEVEQLQNRILMSMGQFRKLRISDMFPEMTKSDGMTLMAIGHYNRNNEKKLTVSGLAEIVKTKPSAISRTLKSLEDAGYIERVVNREDRRNTYVALTTAGEAECAKIDGTMREFFQAVFGKMQAEDLERLITYLDELYEVAKTEIAQRSPGKQA